ncbi:predicted protein [Nematostella vectensis]|uniref:Uncharacterized protein n=1 Tax=Nematostella vectensis TaxID=45351 RepID=A7S1N0_NEMVE|nr:predicted protein [Nematostella vectensis]|eukprot:XP_001634452.1 predicted protein [Nematostella vectensis]
MDLLINKLLRTDGGKLHRTTLIEQFSTMQSSLITSQWKMKWRTGSELCRPSCCSIGKHVEMSKRTVFNNLWLQDPLFPWVAQAQESTKARCKMCSVTFELGNMGKQALISHAKGKKHLRRVAPSTQQVSLNSFVTVQKQESEQNSSAAERTMTVPPPPVDLSQVASSSDSSKGTIKKYVTKDETLKAEVLWAIKVLMSHYSCNSSAGTDKLFSNMFPDSVIAKQFQCGATKCSYLICFGIAPFFHDELMKRLQEQGTIVGKEIPTSGHHLVTKVLNRKKLTKEAFGTKKFQKQNRPDIKEADRYASIAYGKAAVQEFKASKLFPSPEALKNCLEKHGRHNKVLLDSFKKFLNSFSITDTNFIYHSEMFTLFGPLLQLYNDATRYGNGLAREVTWFLLLPVFSQLRFRHYWNEAQAHVVGIITCFMPLVRNAIEVVGKLHAVFDNSPKRFQYFKEKVNELEKEATKVKLINVCRTRWIDRIEGMHRVIELLQPVAETFKDIALNQGKDWNPNSRIDAQALVNALSFSFIITVVVVSYILDLTKPITVKLQAKEIDLLKAKDELRILKSSLRDMQNNIDERYNVVHRQAVEPGRKIGVEPSMPRIVQRQVHRDNSPAQNPEQYYKINLTTKFLDHALQQLDKRFQDEVFVCYKGLSRIPSVHI